MKTKRHCVPEMRKSHEDEECRKATELGARMYRGTIFLNAILHKL